MQAQAANASVKKGVWAQGCKTLPVQIPGLKLHGQPAADRSSQNVVTQPVGDVSVLVHHQLLLQNLHIETPMPPGNEIKTMSN